MISIKESEGATLELENNVVAKKFMTVTRLCILKQYQQNKPRVPTKNLRSDPLISAEALFPQS